MLYVFRPGEHSAPLHLGIPSRYKCSHRLRIASIGGIHCTYSSLLTAGPFYSHGKASIGRTGKPV